MQSAETTLLLREKRLSLVRQRLRLTQTRHDAGAASWMELFTAETEVFQAQIDASQALWDYNLKKARLLWLAGQGAPLVIPAEYQELFRGDRPRKSARYISPSILRTACTRSRTLRRA